LIAIKAGPRAPGHPADSICRRGMMKGLTKIVLPLILLASCLWLWVFRARDSLFA
jgi:hypothetical protein